MLIFDSNGNIVVLNSLHEETNVDYFWTFDTKLMDFKLSELTVLEESWCESIKMSICGFSIIVPCYWHIMVVGGDEGVVDVVKVSDLPGNTFNALVYGRDMTSHASSKIKILDYISGHKTIAPSLMRHQMLCHPISQGAWVAISSSSAIHKNFKNVTIDDITY